MSARRRHDRREASEKLLVAAGAAAVEGDDGGRPKVAFLITGWWMESAFTKRPVQFG